jgi:TonB family protein
MENHSNISRETLLRYLNGELSDDEAWKVEKAMQEDPFLAEAMEGLELSMQKGDLSEDLEELERRINIREEGKARVLFTPFMRVAAVILVLAVSTAGVYELFFRNPSRKGEIAMKKNESGQDTTGSVTYNDAGTAQPEPKRANPVLEPSVKPRTEELNREEKPGQQPATGESSGSIKSAYESKDQLSENKDDEKQAENNLDLSVSPTVPDTFNSIEISPSVSPAEQIPSAICSEAAAGAMKKEAKFKMDRASKAQAVTDNDEVLYAGINQCHPVTGDSAYSLYIYTHLKFPDAAQQKGIEGEVWVQFTVNPDSTLHNFYIVKSLGSGCDEEAIRLIKQGPEWVPQIVNGKAVISKPVYKIPFSLKSPEKK